MKTHHKNLRKPTPYDRFDRIYDDWPHCPRIRSVVAKPLKSIYYNRAANEYALDIILNNWKELETFCDTYDVILQ